MMFVHGELERILKEYENNNHNIGLEPWRL
jgi:hypothetical protein